MAARRKIFEDADKVAPVATPVLASGFGRPARFWLLLMMALTVATLVIGGATRLTDSGLSITEWRPIAGALPPLGEAAWRAAFESYRQIPEFAIVNPDMTLESFRVIYWWEWGHRQLARLVGLVWAIGFAWLALRGGMSRRWALRFAGLGALGGLQGAIGWWMVSSGLTGSAIDVAPARLAIHLGLAVAIFGLMLWYAMELGRERHELFQARRTGEEGPGRFAATLVWLAFAQMLAGALVAGTDAGEAFPTWPLMNGEFLPEGSFAMTPILDNFLRNPSLVHFNHRLLGYVLAIVAALAWWRSRGSGRAFLRRAFSLLLALIAAQAMLGILTALHAAALPLALPHQLGGLAVFAVAVWLRFQCRYPPT